MPHGLYLFHKKTGEESHESLRTLKKSLGLKPTRRDIGHTGTLDPFASGLLLVGIGEGTKLLGALSELPKTYIGEVILGATTVPLDWEEDRSYQENPPKISEEKIREFCSKQIGHFFQVPPAHSAIKIAGKRSYEWAREGKAQEMPTRKIEIINCEYLKSHRIQDQGHELQGFDVELRVTSGTYIRSLARDWGQNLTGFPGSLRHLHRNSIGPWQLGDLPPGAFRKLKAGDLKSFFDWIPLEEKAIQRLNNNGVFPDLQSLKPSNNGWCFVDSKDQIHGVWVETPAKSFRRVIQVENPKKIE